MGHLSKELHSSSDTIFGFTSKMPAGTGAENISAPPPARKFTNYDRMGEGTDTRGGQEHVLTAPPCGAYVSYTGGTITEKQ